MSDGLHMPFGLNIKLPQRTMQQVKETVQTQVSQLWTPLTDYFESNNGVFTGDIQAQIESINRQTYNLGAIMRDGVEKPKFDMKM